MAIGDELFCFHCGHKWYRRIDFRPAQCPKCTSRTWDGKARPIYNRSKKKNRVEKIEEEKTMIEKNVGQPTETSFTPEKIKPKLKIDY